MAGDDDVTIKIASDVDAALLGVASVIGGFSDLSEAVEKVTEYANELGLTAAEAVAGIGQKLTESSLAGTEFGDRLAGTLDQIKQKLDEQAAAQAAANAAQEAAIASGIVGVENLAAVEKQYADQKAANEARIAEMSAESKAAIDKSTESLLAQGMGFDKVAQAAGLTKEQLKVLTDEQDKLTESSKTFLDKWIEGIKGSEVATVTAGVLMADALKTVGGALLDLAKSFPTMITAAAAAGDELQTMANRFNMSVEAVDQMKFVADQANVSFDGMARASQRLTSQLSDDTSKASKSFKEMGLNAEELRKDPEKALYAFIKAVKETVPPADQAAKMTEVLGSRAGALTGLLKENVAELIKDADALGASAEATRTVAAEGEAYQDNLGRIKRAQEAWRDEMASHFLPVINKVLHAVPELGGFVLTLGQGFMSAATSLLPLITNIAALQSTKLGASILTWIGSITGWTAVTKVQTAASGEAAVATGSQAVATEAAGVAAAAATPPTTMLAGAMTALQAAILPVTIALASAYAIYKLWAAASAETGWVRYISDGFERLGLALAGYTKEQTEAMIAQDHATQKQKEAADVAKAAIEAQKKAAEEAAAIQKLQDDAAAKRGTGLQELQKHSADVAKAVADLTAEQKKQILASIAQGMSAKEVAEVLRRDMKVGTELATEAIELFNKTTKEATKSAEKLEKQDPFSKMAKSALDLGKALSASGGADITQLVDEYGKKAFEVVNLASTMKDGLKQVTPAVMEVAQAFQRTEINKELEKIKKSSEDAADALTKKMVAGATAAASALKNIVDSMTAQTLAGDELRLFQINKVKDDTIAAQTAIAQNATTTRQQETAAALADYDAQKKMLETKRLMGQQVSVEDETAIAKALEARLNASAKLEEQTIHDAENQMVMAKVVADNNIKVMTEGTGFYEADAVARGVISQKAAAAELKIQQKKLETMEDARSNATDFEKEQQRQLIADLTNEVEKDLQQRGVMTQAAREREYTAAKANLDKMLQAQKDGTAKFYDWEILAAQAHVDRLTDVREKEADALGLQTRAASAEISAEQDRRLTYMKNNSALFTKSEIAEQEKRVRAAKIASGEISTTFIDGLSKMANAATEVGSAIADMGAQMGNAGVEKFGKGMAFAGETMKGMQDVMELMDAKDTIGAIIAAVKLAIKTVGKLWDSFTNTKGEKAMKSIGRNFRDSMGEALEVSEEFGDKIAATAKDMFGGSDFQAQLYHLNDIIEEAGGLSEKNFSNMTGRLRDVFTQVGNGSFTVETATKILDENFTTFAEHTLESGKIASKGFQEIIALNAQFGTQSKEIADFVSNQVTRLGTAFQTMLAPLAKGAQKVGKDLEAEMEKVTELSEERDKLLEKIGTDSSRYSADDQKALARVTEEWNKQQQAVIKVRAGLDGMAAEVMPQVHRAGNLLTASFNAATASGMSMVAAVDQMGPGLDELLKTTEALGITTEAAGLAWIVDFRDRVNVNRELVDSAGSLNEVMMAMSNIGALNAESMADLQAQGTDTYNSLIEAGFSENESLKMMQSYLQQVRDAHTELGLPIDENTQGLIDQAEASGVLAKEQMSTNDIMLEGLSAIIKALGGEMPAAFDRMSKSAVDAAGKMTKAMDTKVGTALDENATKIEETDWKGYGEAGLEAAQAPKEDMDALAGSLMEVTNRLSTDEWDEWATAAVEAAEKVSYAVDAVSLGHSPGGIKEMPIKLNEAMDAFDEWERKSVMSAKEVEAAVNESIPWADPVAYTKSENKKRQLAQEQAMLEAAKAQEEKTNTISKTTNASKAAGSVTVGDIYVSINTSAIDSTQRAREVAEEMMREMTAILSRKVQYSVKT